MLDFPLWGRIGVGIAAAALLAYMATPIAILTARRFAFYDRPVGYKGHAAPTPYLGGAAVMLAFAVAVLLGAGQPLRALPLLGGAAVLWAVGTIDDRRTVSPWLRVLVEFSLAVALSLLGRGWELGAGEAVNALINGIWVVGVINAFNLFDNMDGAASTMGIVVAAGACVLGWLNGNAWAVGGSAALCGACLGFLPHNLSRPAKIFLGDGGSMPLGFAVAMLVASAAHGAGPSLLSLLTGLLLIGLPALDTTLVIISRRRRGVSILAGGQDHLTHRTRTRIRTRTARRVALVLGAIQALISAAVIIATRTSSAVLVYTVLGFVIFAIVAILALEQAVETAGTAGGTRIAGAAAVLRDPKTPWLAHIAPLALITIGVGAGVSALFSAYYGLAVWIPIGLVLVILGGAGIVFRPPRLNWSLILALSGIAGLGLLSLISTGWASAAEQATTDANRWLAYGALLLLLAVLLRGRRHARVLLAATVGGIAVVAAVVVARLLLGDAGSLFLGGRLNGPLGYINGEGCVFAMGCWFGLALAERREPLWAGIGAAAAVAFASLTLLTQSRGAAIASAAAILVTLLALPGRPRRVFALTVTGAGLAGAAGALLHVYSVGQAGMVPGSAARHAGLALVAAAAAAGALWSLLVWGARQIERHPGSGGHTLHKLAVVGASLVVALPVVAGLAKAGSIEHTVRAQWHAFVSLSDASQSPSSSQTRLLSGAGNRYDYWRVAWKVFRRRPLAGVGAGNFSAYYYRYRHTTEAIENPHSIELQTLSELGVIGAVLLLTVVAGVSAGVVRMRRTVLREGGSHVPLVAVTGVLVVWLVDTSGDWMLLLPGVTAVAVAMAAVACTWPPAARGLGEERAPEQRHDVPRVTVLAGAAVAALVLAVAGANLLRQGLAQRYLSQARSALARQPAAAVSDAQKSLRLDGANLDAYYVEAAGEARFDRAAAAERTLLAAEREDPQTYVTWVLLGDLQVRRHNFGAARRFYSHAHLLDPNDPSVAALAEDPASALGGAAS